MKINSSEECEIKLHDLAAQLVPQLAPGIRRDILLVADAPVDMLEPDHSSMPTPWSGPWWLRVPGTQLPAWIWQC